MERASIENHRSLEENLVEKSRIPEKDLVEGKSSAKEKCAEFNSLSKEYSVEDKGSKAEECSRLDEDLCEENSLSEEDSAEEISLGEEDTSEESYSTEDLDEENSLADEDSVEENSLVEDVTEENSTSDEDLLSDSSSDSEEEISSLEGSLVEDNSSDEENWIDVSDSDDEISSAEDNSSTKEESVEEMEKKRNCWIEEHGFVLLNKNFLPKRHRVLQIVVVGDGDCGKTELIQNVFGDHPSFTVTNQGARIEYRIFLAKYFHIFIHNVNESEFLRKANFLDKSVFLFCYDVDNLENLANLKETWISPVLKRSMKGMHYFLVGLKRESNPVSRINTQVQKMDINQKMKELHRCYRAGCLIECFLDDKRSLVNVFQTAIDAMLFN